MRTMNVLILSLFLSGLMIQAQSYTVSTFAGTDTLRDGGQATATLLQHPVATVTDSAGNLYIADASANRIRKVSPTGIVTTYAGTGMEGFSGDGLDARQAELDYPTCLAVDKDYLYICDYYNQRVRRVRFSTGIITTVAGNGNTMSSGDDGPAVSAGMDPISAKLDGAGNLYVADYFNHRIRKISLSDGKITTAAGLGTRGYTGDSGPAALATLSYPVDLAFDASGNMYIADQYNCLIRKVVLSTGIITTFAGDGYAVTWGDGGPASQASFYLPDALAFDAKNNQLLILSDDCVRAISLASGIISRVAGTTDVGFKGDNGPALSASFAWSVGLSVLSDGTIYVSDAGNFRVRKISAGLVTTAAGTDIVDNIPATQALLNSPAVTVLAPNGDLVIADTGNERIRRVSSAGTITTFAGKGLRASTLGYLAGPTGMAFDPQGTLFVADSDNSRILRVTGAGTIANYAGGKKGFSGDTGLGGAALFANPSSIAFDSAGNMYIADWGNHRVRKVDAATGIINTIAGNGKTSPAGINGQATQAGMDPISVAVDAGGNVYIADMSNHRILKVTATTGIVTIVAGTGGAGFSGDGGQATRAQIYHPTCVVVDAAGVLYICDYWNSVLRRVSASGIIQTIAGNGAYTFDRDNGPALGVSMAPFGATLGAGGTIYIADPINNRIRKLTPQVPSTLTIASGNNQKGDPKAIVPISVKIADATGTPVGGVLVSFSITSGSAMLSSSTATTGGDGTATVSVTLGATAGPVVVTASSAGLSTVTFNLTVNQVITVPVPQISPGGVAGAGLSIPVMKTVVVNGMASVFGQNFAAAGTAARVGNADLVEGKVPTNFAGVCVLVGKAQAPIFAVYPGQINFQIPAIAAGPASVQVVTSCGNTGELRSNIDSITVAASAPEFFYAQANADGVNPIAARDAVTYAMIGPATLYGGGFTPARPSSFVALYGTSFGATTPAVAPGEFPAGLAPVNGTVKVRLGTRDLPSSAIQYVGVAPGFPGLFQLNIVIPDDMPDGDHQVVLTINGVSSPTGPYLSVKQ